MLNLQIPHDYVSFEDRLWYAELAREKLRRQHNAMGAQLAAAEISEDAWRQYLDETFGPQSDAIADALASIHGEVKAEVQALPDDAADLTALDLSTAFTESTGA